MKIGVVVSDFNLDITSRMLESAKASAESLGVGVAKTFHVNGVFDLPLAAKKLLERSEIDCVVALGAVIKGETAHDEVIVNAAALKLTDLSLEFNKPVGLGIIGHHASRRQAEARAEEYAKRAVETVARMFEELK